MREMYLAGCDGSRKIRQQPAQVETMNDFFAVAAQMMRQSLLDYPKPTAAKRGRP
jgi:hypothetical protein